MIDELKTAGGLQHVAVIAAVLVGAAGAFVYAPGWLSPNRAPPSLVFSGGGDQVAVQRGVDSLNRIAQIGPDEPYAPASG